VKKLIVVEAGRLLGDQQMFYLCESEATATTNFLSVQKRSDSGKCFL